ncbi:MAG: sugar ABC transporter permease [Caulobacteraceae bacterium]
MTEAAIHPLATTTPPTRRGARGWANYGFVAPYLCVYLLMLVTPLIAGAGLSLFKADLFGVQAFVGLGNFARLLTDQIFLGAVVNTFYFVLLTVPALAAIGLGLALALNRQTRTAAILRAVFFSPTVLSVTIVTLIWRMVFLQDNGLITTVLAAFHLPPIPFLDDVLLAMPALALTTIWWGVGLPMVLFLAALQQVPAALYEAAALDSAGPWRTLFNITLPSIRRTVVLVLVMQVIMQFQLFGQAQLLTMGGPSNASRPLVLFIYEAGFRQWDLGYAAAAAQVLFVLIMIVAMVQYTVARKSEDAQ